MALFRPFVLLALQLVLTLSSVIGTERCKQIALRVLDHGGLSRNSRSPRRV